jgi:hypothetical protein
LRDFDSANVSCGSISPLLAKVRRLFKSAMPPIPTELMRHNKTSRRATNRHMQCSKAAILASRLAAGASGQANRKHRSLTRLAGDGHVTAPHTRELAREGKGRARCRRSGARSESAWVNSWNSFACCALAESSLSCDNTSETKQLTRLKRPRVVEATHQKSGFKEA